MSGCKTLKGVKSKPCTTFDSKSYYSQRKVGFSLLFRKEAGQLLVPTDVIRLFHTSYKEITKRKPKLLLRFVGVLLLRFATRQFSGLLFQLPPRFTRLVPNSKCPLKSQKYTFSEILGICLENKRK